MRFLYVLLLMGCSASDFSSSLRAEDEKNQGGGDATLDADIIASGLDYDGDPIVLKDPPPDNLVRYTEISSEWEAKRVVTRTASHDLNGNARSVSATITPLTATRQNVQSVDQVSRSAFTDQWEQRGQRSSRASKSFTQTERGILDVLLVIDNSGSMEQEIANVRDNLAALLSRVGDSNWQIAMVKSDPPDECVVEGLITSATSSYATAYQSLLEFDLAGGSEHMLKKARWALEGKSGTHCDGRWLRTGSTVAVIIASDEGHQCPDDNICSIDNYRRFATSFGHDVVTYGFVPLSGKHAWDRSQRAIFNAYGSVTGNYSAIMGEISANIHVHLKDIFTLSVVPDGHEMTVKVNNVPKLSCSQSRRSNCYKVVPAGSGYAVQFIGYKPPQGASIVVQYTHGAVPFDTEWGLSYSPLPDPATTTVTLFRADGTTTALQRGSGYTIAGATLGGAVVPQGAVLRIEYLQNIPLRTQFTLDTSTGRLPDGATLLPNTVQVGIGDGAGNVIRTLTSGFSFDGTTLTFTDPSQAPAAGVKGRRRAQSFAIAYRYEHGFEDSYSFTLHGDHRPDSALSCHNETRNDSVVTCQHDSSAHTITFTDADQLAAGDVVVITEQLKQQGNNFALQDPERLEDEVVQLGLPGSTEECDIPSQFIVNNEVLIEDMTVADCSLMHDLIMDREQAVDYVYRVFRPEDEGFLQMDASFFKEHRGKYKFEYWEVAVNGERTNKFEVEDYLVVLHDDVEIGKNATVTVKVHLYHAL